MSGLTAGRASLLSISRLTKSYGGVAALKDASLVLEAGEVLALMGENGAGKSTLIKILAGAVAPDGGTISLLGDPVTIKSPRDAYRRGLRFIHQELNIVSQLSVAENIFLGRPYPTRLGGLVDWRKLNALARAALDELGVEDVAAAAIMARLPIGDRMLVNIAATFLEDLASPARLFVMDEPTAALTGEESERLFRLIAELQRRGCGVLYVSHRIDEVLRISNRITVLRDGETRATLATYGASKAALIELMTGRDGAETYASPSGTMGAGVALSVENLGDGDLDDISFNLHEGEILGVAGLANAGQDRLLKALMARAKRGRVFIGGKVSRTRSPAKSWKQGLAYVPRERRSEGLFLLHDVTRNVVLPHLSWLNRFGAFVDRRAERATVTDVARRVRLKSAGLHQRLWQLSGGNQQKIMFARAMAGAPKVLLLDEPTRGVDIGAKFDIYALLRELAASGAAILLSSSDHSELLALANRIAILRHGRISTIVSSEGLTPQRLLALCYGDPVE
jgi:ABC-type sugar transport system ATPase subunit